MTMFWAHFSARYLLFVMLLIAWPVKRAIQLHMRDGRLKRLLLYKVPQRRVEAFERVDDKINASLLRFFDACFSASKRK